MDKVLFSISKTGRSTYVLVDNVERRTYKFQEFSDIIDAFSSTDRLKFPSDNRVIMTAPQQNKVNIFQRISRDDKKSVPKYFWSDSIDTFDNLEQVSVREVLKDIKQNMVGW
jgi:hypothetical protein